MLRYHFNCCRHPWMKTESPKFIRGYIADPKRSENHLATLQESLKLPLIRHNHYHVTYGMWNEARVILFSSSSLNGSRPFKNKDVFRYRGITNTSSQQHSGIRTHLPRTPLSPCRTVLLNFSPAFYRFWHDRSCDHTFLGKNTTCKISVICTSLFFAEGLFNQNVMLISLSVERALLKISVWSNEKKKFVFVLTYLQ